VEWHESAETTAYSFHYEGERRIMRQEAVADPWSPEQAVAAIGDATWIHRFYNTTFWAAPGGDFVVTASATTTVGSVVGFYTWGPTAGMVADVQTWLDAPAANFGWLLLGNETTTTTAKRFNTREHSDPTTRPALIVEYVPPYAIYLPILLKN